MRLAINHHVPASLLTIVKDDQRMMPYPVIDEHAQKIWDRNAERDTPYWYTQYISDQRRARHRETHHNME